MGGSEVDALNEVLRLCVTEIESDEACELAISDVEILRDILELSRLENGAEEACDIEI